MTRNISFYELQNRVPVRRLSSTRNTVTVIKRNAEFQKGEICKDSLMLRTTTIGMRLSRKILHSSLTVDT